MLQSVVAPCHRGGRVSTAKAAKALGFDLGREIEKEPHPPAGTAKQQTTQQPPHSPRLALPGKPAPPRAKPYILPLTMGAHRSQHLPSRHGGAGEQNHDSKGTGGGPGKGRPGAGQGRDRSGGGQGPGTGTGTEVGHCSLSTEHIWCNLLMGNWFNWILDRPCEDLSVFGEGATRTLWWRTLSGSRAGGPEGGDCDLLAVLGRAAQLPVPEHPGPFPNPMLLTHVYPTPGSPPLVRWLTGGGWAKGTPSPSESNSGSAFSGLGHSGMRPRHGSPFG